MDQAKFKKWLWLWRQGLAAEPEIQALIVEVSTGSTGLSEFMAQVQPIAEELQSIGLIAGSRSDLATQYWMGPDWAIGQLRERVEPFTAGLRCWTIGGGNSTRKEWFDYWTDRNYS